MNEDERKEAMIQVFTWIEESLGNQAANTWLIGCTPYPFGLPTDPHLNEGLRVASMELHLNDLLAEVEAEMSQQMQAYRESREIE